jgi:hypothetical protein
MPNQIPPAFILPFITSMAIFAHSSEINIDGDHVNHFPALQDLVYVRSIPNGRSSWQPLLQVSGHTLTRVVLSVYDEGSLREELIVMKQFCPNLTRLDIALWQWADLSPECDIPPVTILGLHCSELRAKSHQYNNLFGILCIIRPPSLKAVRFLDHHIVDNLRNHHPRVWNAGIHRLTVWGCRVEDHEGVCLSPKQSFPSRVYETVE